MSNGDHLIWIDLEMSGLDPKMDRILEVALAVTDNQLSIVAERDGVAIYQPQSILLSMDSWCITTHSKTGLLTRVQQSQLNEETAEQQMIAFLQQWVPAGISPMCGNSVHQDRYFLRKYMPQLEKYFHYRCIDVSTLKELARRWQPHIYHNLNKKNEHSALADLKASIAELAYYRQHFICH